MPLPFSSVPGAAVRLSYRVPLALGGRRRSYEFELVRNRLDGGLSLCIPGLGPDSRALHPEQAEWVNRTFRWDFRVRETWSTEWALSSPAAAAKVEKALLGSGRLESVWTQVEDRGKAACVLQEKPKRFASETLTWNCHSLPQAEKGVRYCLLVLSATRKERAAWCACYPADIRKVRPSAWFRERAQGGLGSAPPRMDSASRPMEGFRLSEDAYLELIRSALTLAESCLDQFSARWDF